MTNKTAHFTLVVLSPSFFWYLSLLSGLALCFEPNIIYYYYIGLTPVILLGCSSSHSSFATEASVLMLLLLLLLFTSPIHNMSPPTLIVQSGSIEIESIACVSRFTRRECNHQTGQIRSLKHAQSQTDSPGQPIDRFRETKTVIAGQTTRVCSERKAKHDYCDRVVTSNRLRAAHCFERTDNRSKEKESGGQFVASRLTPPS